MTKAVIDMHSFGLDGVCLVTVACVCLPVLVCVCLCLCVCACACVCVRAVTALAFLSKQRLKTED